MDAPKKKLLRWWQVALIAPIVIIIVPVAIVALASYLVASASLYVAIWLLWCSRGKDVLFVYSESPIWREYLEAQVLPKIAHRAVVLRVHFKTLDGSTKENTLGISAAWRNYSRTSCGRSSRRTYRKESGEGDAEAGGHGWRTGRP